LDNFFKKNKIYNNSELQDFLISLESRYKIELARDKYHNLVNFSTNKIVPFHKWFIYREGFSCELITELIKMSGAGKEEFIIDPFCGSGTTNIVASLNGYNNIGLDVNPMSAYITDVKIDHYSVEDINKTREVLATLEAYPVQEITTSLDDIKRYFSTKNFKELIVIREFINSQSNQKVRKLLKAAFISIIIDCSDRKRDGNGLKKRESKVNSVYTLYKNQVILMLQDVQENTINKSIQTKGIYDSAYNMNTVFKRNYSDASVGAIIFSPPYANSFDYFESYKLELVLGGFVGSIKDLGLLREKAVRSFIGVRKQRTCEKYIDLIAEEIENAIPAKEKETGRIDTRSRKVPNMIRGYFEDMNEVLRQCSLCLKKGKKTYIVVDQSSYLGKVIPTDLLLSYLAEQNNFSVEKIIECRSARTSTQQLKKYPYLKQGLRESIIELKKL